jgi:hypothetical protein
MTGQRAKSMDGPLRRHWRAIRAGTEALALVGGLGTPTRCRARSRPRCPAAGTLRPAHAFPMHWPHQGPATVYRTERRFCGSFRALRGRNPFNAIGESRPQTPGLGPHRRVSYPEGVGDREQQRRIFGRLSERFSLLDQQTCPLRSRLGFGGSKIKTQTVLPSADTAAMLFWALLASGQINMRKVDGWQALAANLIGQPIDLAA